MHPHPWVSKTLLKPNDLSGRKAWTCYLGFAFLNIFFFFWEGREMRWVDGSSLWFFKFDGFMQNAAVGILSASYWFWKRAQYIHASVTSFSLPLKQNAYLWLRPKGKVPSCLQHALLTHNPDWPDHHELTFSWRRYSAGRPVHIHVLA